MENGAECKKDEINLPSLYRTVPERGTAAEVNRRPRISTSNNSGHQKRNINRGLTDVMMAMYYLQTIKIHSPLFLFKLELGYSPSLALQHPKPTNSQAICTLARPLGVSPINANW